MKHDSLCPAEVHSTAAHHASDAVNLHVAALGFDAVNKFVAVRLADGKSDGALYDSHDDAKRHQSNEKLCAYIRVAPNGATPCAAESMLKWQRMAHDAGFPLDQVRIIPRLTREDQARQMARLR